jgi:hypothetical protein
VSRPLLLNARARASGLAAANSQDDCLARQRAHPPAVCAARPAFVPAISTICSCLGDGTLIMGQRLSACFGATRDERGTREMRRLRAWSEQELRTQPPSSRGAPLTAESLRYFRAPYRRWRCALQLPPVRHALVVNAACGTGDMTEPTATCILCMLFAEPAPCCHPVRPRTCGAAKRSR